MYVTKARHSFCVARKLALAATLSLLTICTVPVVNAEVESYSPVVTVPTINELQGSYSDAGLDNIVSAYTMAATSKTIEGYNSESGTYIYNIPEVNLETGELTNHYYEFYPNRTEPHYNKSRYDSEEEGSYHTSPVDLIGHHIENTRDNGAGAAIHNDKNGDKLPTTPSGGSELGTIVGDFIGNLCDVSNNANFTHGAAIDNHGTVANIYGDFIGNKFINGSYAGDVAVDGGGIRNGKKIDLIVGNFIGNEAASIDSSQAGIYGGAIANHTSANDSAAYIANIGTIRANFVSNKAKDGGGAVYNTEGATITNLDGLFINNSSKLGGGIYNTNGAKIEHLSGTFARNSASKNGGAIYNTANANMTIEGEKTLFVGNSAEENGGAIFNTNGATMTFDGNSLFISNSAKNGGAIYNESIANIPISIDASFLNNTASEKGGAIYSNADFNLLSDSHQNIIRGNAGSSGEGIYMEGTAPQTHQTDVYTLAQMQAALNEPGSTYVAENFIETEPGIYKYKIGENEQQASIYEERTIIDTPAQIPTLTFDTPNNGEWVIYDKITGNLGEGNDPKANAYYDVNMIGGGTVSLFNDIEGGNTTLDSTTLNTINNEVHVYNMHDFAVKGESNMTVDFDIKNERMDRIVTADPNNNTAANTGTLNVSKFNFLNDTNKNKASVLFAEPELAHSVLNHGKAEGEYHRIVRPIRIYDIQYNVHNDDNRGYFEFSSNWNPSILAAPVVLQTGIQSAMNTDIQYAFNHLDTYTKIPKFDRLTLMNNQNKYAFASTDFNENLNSSLRQYNLRENRTSNNGVWLRPYAAFERVPLKNGPKVDSITYGTFLGYDSNFREHKHGWHSVWSTYVGYQGGEIEFKDVRANLNGGVIGLTDTFYKNNFWTALLITGGAMNADISTMYGHEDSMSIAGAIASKTGYNFEFKDGRYIIQPIFKASYTMSKMLDYTNAAGVRIDAKPLHTIQINPSLRFIMNCKNGWQPYARVGMVWNLLNDTNVYAGGYHLPEMHIKPYIEYGLGVQKLYKHRFTGFGQAMVRNGGRNGIAITLGFRYAIGRDNDKDYNNMTRWEKFKSFFVE